MAPSPSSPPVEPAKAPMELPQAVIAQAQAAAAETQRDDEGHGSQAHPEASKGEVNKHMCVYLNYTVAEYVLSHSQSS